MPEARSIFFFIYYLSGSCQRTFKILFRINNDCHAAPHKKAKILLVSQFFLDMYRFFDFCKRPKKCIKLNFRIFGKILVPNFTVSRLLFIINILYVHFYAHYLFSFTNFSYIQIIF